MKILVPTDGSDNSMKALAKAKEYAQAFDVEIDIVNVTQAVVLDTYMLPQYTVKTNRDLHEEGQRILEEAHKFFEGLDTKVNTKLRTGDAATQIMEQIEENDYDMVIMGSRGRGRITRAMLGSVSYKVLNHVDTNVLIIK